MLIDRLDLLMFQYDRGKGTAKPCSFRETRDRDVCVKGAQYILVALRRWWSGGGLENISGGSEQADLAKDPSPTESGEWRWKEKRKS